MKNLKRITLGLAVLMLVSASAMAQPKHLQPGSVLVYPLFDSAPGSGTVICITNTNDDNLYCPSDDRRAGDIMLHYQYVADVTWVEFDRFELLTPGDTLCVIADNHNPEGERGFLVVSAVDPNDMAKRIDFDYLIGSAIVVQSGLNFLWQYTPYVFEGNPLSSDPASCVRTATDADADGAIDFDGTEYDLFPSRLVVDSFFEESGNFTNILTLLTTAGADFEAEIDFLFWNNIEQKFSRSFVFRCWWTGPLSDISLIVEDLGGDEEEIGVNGVENGWAEITPRRIVDLSGNPVPASSGFAVPPILGVFAQFVSGSDFAAGHALHYTGSLDGLEILVGNGDQQQK